jgi:nitronate monooxygenase
MNLHTPVCDLLCCDVPVVLAGMGGVARAELAAAVSEAGGFGFLGMVREPPSLIRDEIAAVRACTDRPFGVNIIPAATPPKLLAEQVEVCLEAQVHAVTLFWDLDPALVARLRAAGVLVVCQVGTVAEAQAAEAAGADILIAQGWEAGGHVRGRTALAPLLSAVVDRVDLPVLAAGGVADGAGLAAALTLGAQGAVIGTAFLATEESFAHDYHKDRVVEAEADDTLHTDVFHINWPPGSFVRVLRNSVTRGVRGDPFFHDKDVIGAEGERPIYLFSTDSPLRSMTGDFEAMALYAGQGVSRIKAVVPAAERLRDIVEDAAARLQPRPAPVGRAPVQLASPVCYAASASDAYMGFAEPEEIAAELNLLLEAKRASARLAARWASFSREPAERVAARAVHGEEMRACKLLFDAVSALQAVPSRRIGGFYDNAITLQDPDARLAFMDREQVWVRQRLRALAPRVRDDSLHACLRQLMDAPLPSAVAAQETLARHASAEPAPPA